MAFEPVFEPGEKISADIRFVIIGSRGRHQYPELRLVLTNRAAYWPGSKFALIDSVTTERVPVSQVDSVSIRPELYWGRLLIGFSMCIPGVIVAIRVATSRHWDLPGFRGGLVIVIVPSVLLLVFGLFIAAHGGWRRTLTITSERTRFTWAEPRSFRGKLKAQVSAIFQQVRDWARSHNLPLQE
ncbi:MAG: hypothetical protein ACKV2Q_02810 [Planctomycetaceae bacterium]